MPREASSREKQRRPSILIVGMGNILMSDEGVGVHIVEAMRDGNLPENVELLDGGTASADLLDSLGHRDKVIILDAVKGGNEPGTLYRFSRDDVALQSQKLLSLHQVSLLETLAMADLLGCLPRQILIFGIEPRKVDWGLELSPDVASVVPRVIELVLSECQ